MKILAIETSCDETSVAVVEDGHRVLANIVASSKATFAALAGVIPEQAARTQVECIMPVLHRALEEAKTEASALDAIAVTRGPGLLGSLLVGTMTARVIAMAWKKPLIGVHHTFGHLSSTWLDVEPEAIHFPLLTLSASGGHTDLWYRASHLDGTLLGRTRDDAAGEAFDKGASMLGLPYPGGPALSKLAKGGDSSAFAFPSPLKGTDTLDFSFSGLKTSLKYTMRDAHLDPTSNKKILSDLAASFQHAICKHLAERISDALKKYPDAREVHLVGGVSANTHLRELTKQACEKQSVIMRHPLILPYCTDNAAMIGAGACFLSQEKRGGAFESFETTASLPLDLAAF